MAIYLIVNIYVFLVIVSYIEKRNEEDRVWNTVFNTLIFTPVAFFFEVLFRIMQVSFFSLTRIFLPISYGFALLIILMLLPKLFNVDSFVNIDIFGYLILIVWSSIYAHATVFKKLYIGILKVVKKIFNTQYTNEEIDKEKNKVENNLLSLHMYILLFIIYFTFNILNFSGAFKTDTLDFISESFLTFVMIDTVINLRKKINEKTRSVKDI